MELLIVIKTVKQGPIEQLYGPAYCPRVMPNETKDLQGVIPDDPQASTSRGIQMELRDNPGVDMLIHLVSLC